MSRALGDGALDADGFRVGVTDGPGEIVGVTNDGALDVDGDCDAVRVGDMDDVTVGNADGVSDANRDGGSEGY